MKKMFFLDSPLQRLIKRFAEAVKVAISTDRMSLELERLIFDLEDEMTSLVIAIERNRDYIIACSITEFNHLYVASCGQSPEYLASRLIFHWSCREADIFIADEDESVDDAYFFHRNDATLLVANRILPSKRGEYLACLRDGSMYGRNSVIVSTFAPGLERPLVEGLAEAKLSGDGILRWPTIARYFKNTDDRRFRLRILKAKERLDPSFEKVEMMIKSVKRQGLLLVCE